MDLTFARIVDIFIALVGVAGAMVVFTSPETAPIIKAFGGAFADSTRAATGRG